MGAQEIRSTLPPTKQRKPKGRPRRASRRIEEDIPSLNYLERMEQLGPREGESKLAFKKRLAAIQAGRILWFKVWKDYLGDQTTCAKALGVSRNNIAYELRAVGLNTELLDRQLREDRKAEDFK